MLQPARMEHLTAALRTAASSAGASAGGGYALLFAAVPGDESRQAASRLRAAAGFDSADAAREAAGRVASEVVEGLRAEGPTAVGPAALGEWGAAGGTAIPLRIEGRVHGVLIVSGPAPLAPGEIDQLSEIAAQAALSLDHAHALTHLDSLRADADASRLVASDKTDELLKLSEELFAQDIELLQNNEKLGKIEKLKNDFIEKMSLELRTPLNSIIEAIISVLAGEHDALSDAARASLRSALDEGTAFQRTLQNILDLWRAKQGELPIEPQEVNFAEVVEEAIFSVQEVLDAKGLRVEKQFENPLPKLVTDLGKTNQILFLLLENAAKFTEEGTIRISARVADGQLECEIADTGIGICADDQQLVFDEFFQVDPRSSPGYRGAGLGLTLVRDLLLLLDGECELVSEPGQGTQVSFRIPALTS